ncbi:hypothetical protein HY008_00650, partial [Candidatus Woesebacteria bacterium]|nr:hypothetical protein [Candidatus Woesebacteria bacterium]
MGNSFNSIIEESQSFLVLLPHSPHLDLVAGGLGLYLTLQKIKETSIACSSPMLVEFNRLIGVNKISQETSAGKHLIIKFTNYEASNIQRVSYDLDKSSDEMFLRVIPKAGVPSP